MIVSTIDKKLEERIVLVAHRPKVDELGDFREQLRSDADLLVELVGAMHGLTALSIFGDRIASYELKHDLDRNEFVGIVLNATRPSHMILGDFLSDIATVWNQSPLAMGEIYKL